MHEDIQAWPYLHNLRLPHINADIGLLIGNYVHEAFEPWTVIHSQSNGPNALKTILGWIVNGPLWEHRDSALDGDEQQLTSSVPPHPLAVPTML